MKIDDVKHGGPESAQPDDTEKQTGDPMPKGADDMPAEEPKANEKN